MDEQIGRMREQINQCRERCNRIMAPDLVHRGEMIEIGIRGPEDEGYLPPVTEFAELKFSHGVVVMPADEFEKLPKYKKRRLMKP